MKHIKKQSEFVAVNEMAKGFPVGTIIKVTNPSRLGYAQYGHWDTFKPDQAKGMEGGLFYMQVTNSGRIWLEGPILYSNGLTNNSITSYKARVATSSAEQPGDEYRIFKKNADEIKAILGKSFFMDGSESGIMSNDGKTASISEAEYTVSGLNFKLTDLYDEPVLFLSKKQGTRNVTEGSFSIKMSDLSGATKELNDDQKEVIAEWFGKELKTAVVNDGDKYKIEYVKVATSDTGAYPSQFNAGPFLNVEQAEKFIELLKKEETTMFNPNSLKVIPSDRWSSVSMNLEEMIAYAKTAGVATTMKQLLALKKGAVAGKKFGI